MAGANGIQITSLGATNIEEESEVKEDASSSSSDTSAAFSGSFARNLLE